MNNHLINRAAEWFDDLETWNAFVELVPLQDKIQQEWLISGTEALRHWFSTKPCPGWQFEEWGNPRDTWWYLDEFGRDSVGIGFGWRYQLCFGVAHGDRADRLRLAEMLHREAYRPLTKAFGRSDPPVFGFALEQFGDFHFGTPTDGCVPIEELAWCAGHNTDAFVQQASAKIEAFTRNVQVSDLLRQLNQELIAPNQESPFYA